MHELMKSCSDIIGYLSNISKMKEGDPSISKQRIHANTDMCTIYMRFKLQTGINNHTNVFLWVRAILITPIIFSSLSKRRRT